jgi:CRP-like cAMP-binding protein
MEKRAYRAGETIFEEGEPGDALFFIACGYVSILAASGPKKDMRFASLGPGLYFGEMALLERSVRSARAVADEDCELYVLKMDDFENLMEEDATIGTRIFATMAKVLSQRLRKVSGELTALESV